jgi:single-strand selective monofunctional uracil DNA glycosylase
MSKTTAKDQFAGKVIRAVKRFRTEVNELGLQDNFPWVYNPLEYAWSSQEQYLSKYASSNCRIVFLGMNPGPWGMAQTGIPFGEVAAVKNFLGIETAIGKPTPEHPKRPIQGFACPRSEVSGRRLWGLFHERFGTASHFFQEHFVANYCPLVFMEESGRNLTPDKLPVALRSGLQDVCDQHLAELIDLLSPEWLIGVGAFAEDCARRVIKDGCKRTPQVGRILHPSPASPAANRDWAGTAIRQLEELGVW